MVQYLSRGWTFPRVNLKYTFEKINNILISRVQKILDSFSFPNLHVLNDVEGRFILEVVKVSRGWLTCYLEYLLKLRDSGTTLKNRPLHNHLCKHTPHTPDVDRLAVAV